MRLVDIVKIDNRFEKSVNLLLDLGKPQKIRYYIPTRSSVKLLKTYLEEVEEFTGSRANILIGPYGKGKSHLLLVLMSVLSGLKSDEMAGLFERIAALDAETKDIIDRIYGKTRFLPVIINTNSGNLGQAFVRSLNYALRREGLEDVVPDNYFSEAVRMINQWKNVYPSTYKNFVGQLKNQDAVQFVEQLEHYDHATLEQFRSLYPVLTSGSEFNPTVDDEVLSVYQSVNRLLCEKYGYTGIYMIFDEFSKYVEGHPAEGFSADMKILQDICELCNSSKEEQFHLTCVAHKAIQAYGDSLSKEVRNAFRGVEGRLKEIPFIVSSQNNYELIADAVRKKPKFEEWKVQDEEYRNMLEESYRIPDFSALFEKADFDKIVGDGCYPLTPLTALLLMGLSEKIAQNERTIFTFLTGKDMYSLANFVIKCRSVCYVGAGLVYDYFTGLFQEEKQSAIHNEWLKAEYALSGLEMEREKAVVKTLAVIHMINRPEDIPASDRFLRLASGLNKENFQKAIDGLKEKNLLVLKRGTAAYEFQNGISVNIENEVSDCARKYFSRVDVSEVLNEVYRQKYILPKKYNQDHFMTRYYRVMFMSTEAFLALSSLTYIKDKHEPDGFLFVLYDGESNTAVKHLSEINDPCAILCHLTEDQDYTETVRMLLAVRKLKEDEKFTEENEAVVEELGVFEQELMSELNDELSMALHSINCVYTVNRDYHVNSMGLNRTVSNICEDTYYMTPVINHESVNRHSVSAQISKARNVILDDILHTRLMNKYESGTSAESTIYRAAILHTAEDKALANVRNEIVEFIHESKGTRVPFSRLVNKLIKAPIGIRRGVLPIYIMEQLVALEDMPVIYNGRVEMSIDNRLISSVVNDPDEYSLYVEVETVQKLEYIEGLETMFADYGNYCREIENRNRLARLTCMMQAWYHSLPQAASTFTADDYVGQPIKEIKAFRKLFMGTVNARELLFEHIPNVFREKDMGKVLKCTAKIKEEIDGHVRYVKEKATQVIRKSLGLPEADDFLLSIRSWYRGLTETAKNSVYSMDSQKILNYIRDYTGSDMEEMMESLSKEVLGSYIEDWLDHSIETFEQGFVKLAVEIKEKENIKDSGQNKKVTFFSEEGAKDCFYKFDAENLSTSGYFFKNALDDVLEDYGESLDNNEKIGILMNMVQKLMGKEGE